jgi:hypothetical protein
MSRISWGIILLALGCAGAAVADDADSRTAKVMDRSGTESQVSGVTVSNVDERFGFEKADDRGRLVVATENIEFAIPLRAVSSIVQAGGETWTVKYQTADGETEVSGALAPEAVLEGNSDFGSFDLPLARLRSLKFAEPGAATKPAGRPPIFDKDGHPRTGSFDGTLTLTDGTELAVTQLRRNEVFAQPVNDPALINARPEFAVVSSNYTDLRLIRGETWQTVPFGNIKSAEFLPGDAVLVRARSGAEAEMKFPRRDEVLEGFTGSCGKGDFYVALKFVKTIRFPETAKPAGQ